MRWPTPTRCPLTVTRVQQCVVHKQLHPYIHCCTALSSEPKCHYLHEFSCACWFWTADAPSQKEVAERVTGPPESPAISPNHLYAILPTTHGLRVARRSYSTQPGGYERGFHLIAMGKLSSPLGADLPQQLLQSHLAPVSALHPSSVNNHNKFTGSPG